MARRSLCLPVKVFWTWLPRWTKVVAALLVVLTVIYVIGLEHSPERYECCLYFECCSVINEKWNCTGDPFGEWRHHCPNGREHSRYLWIIFFFADLAMLFLIFILAIFVLALVTLIGGMAGYEVYLLWKGTYFLLVTFSHRKIVWSILLGYLAISGGLYGTDLFPTCGTYSPILEPSCGAFLWPLILLWDLLLLAIPGLLAFGLYHLGRYLRQEFFSAAQSYQTAVRTERNMEEALMQ